MNRTASDIMTRDVICVRDDMDLRELAKLLLDNHITGAPVVDQHGELQGVVSQTDLLRYSLSRDDELVIDSDFYQGLRIEGRHLPQGFQIEDVNTGRVSDVMTPIVHAVNEGASLKSIARLMTRNHIHRVIVRRRKRVAGIISALDVLKTLTEKTGRATSPRTRAANAGGSSQRRRRAS